MSSRTNSKITLTKQSENELRSTSGIKLNPTPKNSARKGPIVVRNLISRDMQNRSFQLQGKLPPITDHGNTGLTKVQVRAQNKDFLSLETSATMKSRGTSDIGSRNIRIKKPVQKARLVELVNKRRGKS